MYSFMVGGTNIFKEMLEVLYLRVERIILSRFKFKYNIKGVQKVLEPRCVLNGLRYYYYTSTRPVIIFFWDLYGLKMY